MRIFIAGATGVIGVRLVPLLVADGHTVAGMTRSADKAGRLGELGAEPVVCDVFDCDALARAVTAFGPDVVFHQLTDLPDEAAELAGFSDRNDRIRGEGTQNLLFAAAGAKAAHVIAQSISWELPGSERREVTAAHERAVLQAGGVVIRYGKFYGPGTFYPAAPPEPPRIHVDDAARLTMPALRVPAGVTIIADDRAIHTHVGTGKECGARHPRGDSPARPDRPALLSHPASALANRAIQNEPHGCAEQGNPVTERDVARRRLSGYEHLAATANTAVVRRSADAPRAQL